MDFRKYFSQAQDDANENFLITMDMMILMIMMAISIAMMILMNLMIMMEIMTTQVVKHLHQLLNLISFRLKTQTQQLLQHQLQF